MKYSAIRARARQQLGGSIFSNTWMSALLVILIFGAIMGFAYSSDKLYFLGLVVLVIMSGPLEYGLRKLFLKQVADNEPMKVGGLFSGFSDDFGGTIGLFWIRALFTFLWTLLFVIPGIIKTYSYAMTFYIKAEHPEYGWRDCMNQSRAIMDGHKWQLFVLQLTFIGWFIVGALCLGVGTLWVETYYAAAEAQFYREITGAQNVSDAPAMDE